MKKIFICILFCIALTNCSTQKNTGASRAWHQLKVIHNVQFNGEQLYKEGIEALNQGHTDNFAVTLPLYPVSDHQAAEAASSSMDKAIEKCRKSIKLHSIKARPKINPKKRKNAKYQNWLKNTEFNNQLYRAWLMLGKSEFHKGDFLGSVGTFRYVEKLYENDPNMVALCQLWVARAYGEMGWIYEAEDVLNKVKVDDLKFKNKGFYSAVSADILVKGNKYKEAIPFIKVAKRDEKRKQYLPRFEYVLAQLYQDNGQNEEARNAYKRAFRLHPKDVAMDFNARIHYAELNGDTAKSIRQLKKMTKLYKYRDNLDQLYGTIGNIYLAHKDTLHALDCYQKGIEESTKSGNEKGEILIIAGDLYYDFTDYAKASPCYKEAATIISADHPAYRRVSHRSEVLDEVVVETQTIQLQDSLQHLGSLPQEEQLKIINQLIADLKEKEKQDSIKLAEANRQNELESKGGLQSVDMSRMLGNRTGEAANWYFYNPQLMRSGQQEFIRKWGNRVLEDNWRRLSKTNTTSISDIDNFADSRADSIANNDSTSLLSGNDSIIIPSTDIYSPEYYLQQIPKTPDDYANSNALIADAMYNLIYIYRDKVGDEKMSYQTWQEFCQRFPQDERMVDLYYDQYLTALRLHQDDSATIYRNEILNRYPESPQAKIVSDPNYFESLRRMAIEQDSLYESTYNAYTHNAFAQVKANKQYAESNIPLTPLMPRFLFLNAIATAKTEGQIPFKNALQDMVDRYPENELSAMAKDMLAMMNEGLTAQKGNTTSTLTAQRQQTTTPTPSASDLTATFSKEKQGESLLCIVIPNDEEQLNNLLYQVALYNFTQFLIKDFDLTKVPMFTIGSCALEVSGFESLEEAEWYLSLLNENAELNVLFKQMNAQLIPITQDNLQLINRPFTLDEYIDFYQRLKP
ncbi:MAG: tetratricopeptide repeat protein [Paludibacteraceae bacterium]|nr:tetratricopeptide repeat protein [Paludibacteraceae bacterium]